MKTATVRGATRPSATDGGGKQGGVKVRPSSSTSTRSKPEASVKTRPTAPVKPTGKSPAKAGGRPATRGTSATSKRVGRGIKETARVAAKTVPRAKKVALERKVTPKKKVAPKKKKKMQQKVTTASTRGVKAGVKHATRSVAQGRGAQTGRLAPIVRFAIRELDPIRKCGPDTSVQFLYRVDESIEGRTTPHLVFFDRHGWYCEHGRSCPAVAPARKYNGHIARIS